MKRKPMIVLAVTTGMAAAALAGVARHRALIAGVTGQILRTSSVATETVMTAAAATTPTAATPSAQAVVVPAGTTLMVRLGEKLGSKISQAGQSFAATLDQDVVVNGKTVIAAGTSVNGEVAFVRPGGALVAEPKLQLKVTSVNVNNADLEVATSIRSFGPTVKGKKKIGRFIKSMFRHGKAGCQFTSNSELCENLLHKAGGKEKEVLLADQTSYSFTLKQPLQLQ